jgi:hypothetical protein
MASRLAGSSDIFGRNGRRPWASINFVTAHDGFTLTDVVSYNEKHNEANGEENRDGHDANFSWNGGVEGPTDDPDVEALRDRQKRNFLATLLLSLGVPMLLAGDEIGRTQGGNNNAYCQDNEISWTEWETIRQEDQLLCAFVRDLVHLRRQHRVFSRTRFFRGEVVSADGLKDITWVTPEGREMTEADWQNGFAQCLGYVLNGGRAARHRRKLPRHAQRLSRGPRVHDARAAGDDGMGAAARHGRAHGTRRGRAALPQWRQAAAQGPLDGALHQPLVARARRQRRHRPHPARAGSGADRNGTGSPPWPCPASGGWLG